MFRPFLLCILFLVCRCYAAINPDPELRVVMIMGLEEPASTLFSLVLTVLVAYGFFRIRKHIIRFDTYPYWWILYGLFGLFFLTALGSTLFHGKENKANEKLDYFSVMLGIYWSAYFALLRLIGHRVWKRRKWIAPVAGFVFLYYPIQTVFYMTWFAFDYQYHMFVCCIGSVLEASLWILLHWREGTQHTRFLIYGHVIAACGSLFEFYDFKPPLFGMLDGHALWHACILGVVSVSYRFFEADPAYCHRMERRTLL